jgi:glycosyltransferase involved in cell wall biosynthesis
MIEVKILRLECLQKMRSQKLLSVVVNNYNYGRFVGTAIASALNQNSELTEVIVVDDGSTDDSRDVISKFGDCIATVFKSNGGQASALNAGFKLATGRWTVFLDADDLLHEDCAERLSTVAESETSKITWSMPVIGPSGERCMGTAPAHAPASGDLRQHLIDKGPMAFDYAPCSGNAWSRAFLDAVLPIPEEPFRQGADGYLVLLSPLFGRSVVLDQPLSAYRRHGNNYLAAKSQFEMRDELRQRNPILADILAQHMERCGLAFDRSNWRFDYLDRLDELEVALLEHVPQGQSFILVDDEALNISQDFHNRLCRTLTDLDGNYVGHPENGSIAVKRLRTFQQQGARYIVFMWHSFWWFDCYPELRKYLDVSAARLHRSDTSMIFRLNEA